MYIQYSSADYDIALNVSHIRCDRFLIHSHPYYELHYFVRGDVEMIYDGQIIRLQPQGLTLISANVPHGIRVLSDKDYERYTVHFTADCVQPELRARLSELFDTKEEGTAVNHIRSLGSGLVPRLMKELVQMHSLTDEEKGQLVPPLINALVVSILLNRYQMHEKRQDEKELVLSSEEVIEYINMHLTRPLTLTDLANTFYCSKGYLNNLFKRETGFTVMNYIQYRRLNYAKMLIENRYPVSKACVMAGFNEYSSFYRAYVKHFGTAPSDAVLSPAPAMSTIAPLLRQEDEGHAERKSIWDLYKHENPKEDPAILHDT